MKAHALLAGVIFILAGPIFLAFGGSTNHVESVSSATNAFVYGASGLLPGAPEGMPFADIDLTPWSCTPQEALGPISNTVASASVPATNIFVRGTPSVVLPGIYRSTPYSGLIIVPDLVDSRMAHAPTSTNEFAILFLNPPLHLERKR